MHIKYIENFKWRGRGSTLKFHLTSEGAPRFGETSEGSCPNTAGMLPKIIYLLIRKWFLGSTLEYVVMGMKKAWSVYMFVYSNDVISWLDQIRLDQIESDQIRLD